MWGTNHDLIRCWTSPKSLYIRKYLFDVWRGNQSFKTHYIFKAQECRTHRNGRRRIVLCHIKLLPPVFILTPGVCHKKSSSGFPGELPKTQNNHCCFAAGTFKNRSRPLLSPFDDHTQNQLNQGQQFFSITMEEPVIPDSSETFWQDMLNNQK